MKFLTLVTALTLSTGAFAQKKVEFDENQERVCYQQAKKAGCVKGDAATDTACAKAKKSKLTINCRQIFGIE